VVWLALAALPAFAEELDDDVELALPHYVAVSTVCEPRADRNSTSRRTI